MCCLGSKPLSAQMSRLIYIVLLATQYVADRSSNLLMIFNRKYNKCCLLLSSATQFVADRSSSLLMANHNKSCLLSLSAEIFEAFCSNSVDQDQNASTDSPLIGLGCCLFKGGGSLVVDLLFIVVSIVCGVSVFSPCFVMKYFVIVKEII